VKFTISIPRESCTNAKAKYSSSVVPPDPSVHSYHWLSGSDKVRNSSAYPFGRHTNIDYIKTFALQVTMDGPYAANSHTYYY